MREDYSKEQQSRIERYYAHRRAATAPRRTSEHGHGCECKACFEEWAWSTGFETMNPEGRKRAKARDKSLEAAANSVDSEGEGEPV